jgi:DNA-binding NarL/FixJ family response regulator
MIEITVRVKPGCAPRVAALLRTAAEIEADRGQAKALRGAARRIERLTRTNRTAPPRRRPEPKTSTARPIRYRPRVQRPHHPEIDERAVQRVVLGLRPLPVLTRAEARLACWHLTARGCSAPEIAERLCVAQRTVHRWRAEDQAVTV